MNYWWVNQNQTHAQERAGGYLWSPKRNANGRRNPFYEFMRRVTPGDLIFAFADTLIGALGVAQSTAYGFPKPEEFGNAGANWSSFGWRVDVHYYPLSNRIRPANEIERLRPLLPHTYSPLQNNGHGNQGVYLTSVPDPLANTLLFLIGREARVLVDGLRSVARPDMEKGPRPPIDGIALMEERQVESLIQDASLSATERRSIILARRGQGKFKDNVLLNETSCRVTEVSQKEHLIASHIKPWRYCDSAEERLAGSNGLVLTPTIDHLFDRGYISFEDDGDLIVSPVADDLTLAKMGVSRESYRPRRFNSDQKYFLGYHRKEVLLKPDLVRPG